MSRAKLERHLSLRLTDDDLAKARRIAEADSEPYSMIFRRWLRETYEARFASDSSGSRPCP